MLSGPCLYPPESNYLLNYGSPENQNICMKEIDFKELAHAIVRLAFEIHKAG